MASVRAVVTVTVVEAGGDEVTISHTINLNTGDNPRLFGRTVKNAIGEAQDRVLESFPEDGR